MSERRDRFDPELSELFGEDPDLLRLAQRVRESRPEPDLDPRFKAVLRARLTEEARTALAPRPGFRFAPGRLVGWGSLALGVAAVAVAVVLVVGHVSSGGLAVVASNVSHRQSVDPQQAITLSFNQPMDEQSVVTALRIEPATQVTVTWEGPETAVVTPSHPLAADTDYQVTLPQGSVRSQSGQTLASSVTIDFGTAPSTPSSTASPLPLLQPAAVAQVSGDARAFWGPGGAPGATDSTGGVGATPSASPSSSATASPSASPGTSASATASATPVEGAYVFPTGASALALSDAPASAVEVSPNGLYIALAVAGPNGDDAIVVENADGTGRSQLWPAGSAAGALVTALAWDGDNQIVFVTPQGIEAVDLDDQSSQLYAFPSGGLASGVVLAPDGRHAFLPAADVSSLASTSASPSPSHAVSPSPIASPSSSPSGSASATTPSPAASPSATYVPTTADGWLLTIPSGGGPASTSIQLPGSVSGVVGFSGSGNDVAWVDRSGDTATVLEAQTSDPSAMTAVPGAPAEGIRELALDTHGAMLAYALDSGGIEVATSAGTVLGTSPDEVTSLAFSADGSQLAFTSAQSLDVAQVQAASTTSPASACTDADQVLTQFVEAQVAHDSSALSALSGAGAPPAASLTPTSVDRGYVISSSCAAATENSGPTLTASARLIVDPAGSASEQLTDESVVLTQSGGQWLVTGLSVPPLGAEGSGPRVLSVDVTPPVAGSSNATTVVTVTFDSDLDGSSVTASSLSLQTASGQTIPLLGAPTYDPATREATLTVAGTLPAGAEVEVGTGLSDIDGGHPAAVALYPVGG
ncbi:MAG: Ig-like domain-containing protein [Candidatus Dormibacteria bacterium]